MSSDLINIQLQKERQLNKNLLIISAVASVLTLLFAWYVYNKIQSMASFVMNTGLDQVKNIGKSLANEQIGKWLN